MRRKVPNDGDTRITKKFLWFPKTLEVKDLGIRQRRWLEWAWVEQKYYTRYLWEFWYDNRFFC